ncbi:Hypothetical protein PHPALM_8598 [Phytophthora palmivora]|uniref:PiggyBac transposable element-derived protein domain-containing protein n=1 Tax=Phytophthora palmivora TaxID=4796 RepID=A0A2P4Y9G0_9STRA|nr:Hypothetical protein PHPALM_8598 [Phytophthora palmivora]
MNGSGEKTFKQLWRQLSGEGWNARKPAGMNVDFVYLKPGVKGRLNKSQRGVEIFIDDEGVLDVESSDDEDVDSNMGMVDGELRAITESGWVIYKSMLLMTITVVRAAMWKRIADESNRYRERNIPAMAPSRRHKLLQLQAKDPLAHVRDGLAEHWRQSENGAIPRGTFSRYMKRERFAIIMKVLHFNGSTSPAVKVDRAWKILSILQTVEKMFRRGCRLGRVVSFDEGMILNRSKLNNVRVCMSNKPRKLEIYCGADKDKKNCKKKDGELADGPKAVVRNDTKAQNGQSEKRLIVTDLLYSSVALSLRLLELG